MGRRVTQLVLAIALPALIGTAWLGMSLTQAPLTTVDVNRGYQVFQERCASCHGLDQEKSGLYGPNLGRIGAIAAGRVPSLSAEEYLLQSIIDPSAFRVPGEHGAMPADISGGLSSTDLTSLVGFLVTHGGALEWSRLLALTSRAKAAEVTKIKPVHLASVEAGKAIFFSRANCHQCHPLQATPGGTLRAPSLLSAGQHSAQYLRESILHPGKIIAKGYSVSSAWLEDGRVLLGRMLTSTPERLELFIDVDNKLQLVSIDRDELLQDEEQGEMLREMSTSMMPDNLSSTLTENEIEQLIAFLRTLK